MATISNASRTGSETALHRQMRRLNREKYLWFLVLPGIAYFIIFHYFPMYGLLISFKRFSMSKGILGSPWVGFKYFAEFFSSRYLWRILRNTVVISISTLIFGFPAPIFIALLLYECVFTRFKKIVQTVSYLPHFISLVVVVGILVNFVNPVDGIVNEVVKLFGGKPVHFMGEPGWFRPLYVMSNMWQYAGWTSIIYLAALSAIDIQLYESAIIDGARRWQSLMYITIPSLLPTIIIMFIVRMGRMMSVGFEKIILMYSPSIYETADVISTYVYRKGLLGMQYSYGTAVGLFNSIINLVLIITANKLARTYTETRLW